MTREAEINELLRKAVLRPGEVMACLGVTKDQLRAIREARPDAWFRYPGMKHDRWHAAVVRELLGGCGDSANPKAEVRGPRPEAALSSSS